MALASLACLPFVTGKNALVCTGLDIQSPKNDGYYNDRLKISAGARQEIPPSTVAPAAGEIPELHISAPSVLNQQAAQPPEYDLEFNHRSGLTARRRLRTNRIWLEVRI